MSSRALVTAILIAGFGSAGAALATSREDPAAVRPKLIACAGAKAACAANQAAVVADWRKARSGDRQAQRTLAGTLARGADGVARDPVRACAWRIVAAEARGPSGADVRNLQNDCGRLSVADQAAAERLADTIAKRIG